MSLFLSLPSSYHFTHFTTFLLWNTLPIPPFLLFPIHIPHSFQFFPPLPTTPSSPSHVPFVTFPFNFLFSYSSTFTRPAISLSILPTPSLPIASPCPPHLTLSLGFAVLKFLGNILPLIYSLWCDLQDKINIMGYGPAGGLPRWLPPWILLKNSNLLEKLRNWKIFC